MKFTLPLPPSINRTYGVSRTGQHAFYKKRSAKDWEYTAGWEIIRQRGKVGAQTPLLINLTVNIVWYCRIARDIDAGIKILLDLLQKQSIYKNDRQVKTLHVYIIESLESKVEVEIKGWKEDNERYKN